MNPLEAFAQIFGCNVSRPGDWLWAIEENARNRYFMRTRDSQTPRAQALGSRVENGVAVIPIRGVMVKDPYWDDEVSTVAVRRAIEQAAGDGSVRAILLLADSPGGSVAGIEELGEAIDEAVRAKTVVTQVDGMACSAMYEIACHTSAIYARRDHMVGSIGTRLHVFDWSQFAANLGIESIPIDTGEFKSTGAWGTKLTDNQRAYLQEIVDAFQEQFTATVQRGRDMTAEQVQRVATGRVWTGAAALDLSLIDGLQKPSETMTQLSAATSVSVTKEISVMADNATTEPAAPKAATTAELKKTFPNSTAEWREEQTELGATMADAAVAYAQFQEAEAEKARQERDEAQAKAEEAEKKAQQPGGGGKKAGNAPLPTADADDEPADYVQMAKDIQEKKGCLWSEAAREVCRRYPEAHEQFSSSRAAALHRRRREE